jgi:putative cell wall-binding protein
VRMRVFALLIGLFLLASAAPASAVSEVTRLAGENRYDTAAAISCCNDDGSPRQLNTVVLASGLHFADALVGNYLAGLDNGVLLLTDGQSISTGARELLTSAAAESISNVYVIGGEDAVSQTAIDQLADAMAPDNTPRISRVAGETNIDTAIEVARLRPDEIGGFTDSDTVAIVATVGGFADSLAAGPLAYSSKLPVLYTRPGDLPPQTKDALEDLGITDVLIVGGTAAVDNVVQSEISELGIAVQRLAGPTRQETSVAVAEFALAQDGEFGGDEFSLARGDNFADALAGGAHAGFVGSPILLTLSSTQLGTAATGFLQRQSGTLETGWAYGGTGALSESVLEEAREASDGVSS